jgi:hypothetical protein
MNNKIMVIDSNNQSKNQASQYKNLDISPKIIKNNNIPTQKNTTNNKVS